MMMISDYKTLTQLMSEKPQGWLWELTDTTIPISIKTDIEDYFSYRRICTENEDKFRSYFTRTIKLKEGKYLKLMETDLQTIDPTIEFTTSEATTGKTKIDRTGTDTRTVSGTGSTTSTGNSNTSSSSSNDSTITTSNTEKNMAMNNTYPQSIIGSTVGIPDPDSLSWNYATSSSGNRDSNSGSEHNTTTGSGTEGVETNGTTSSTADSSDKYLISEIDNHNLEGSKTVSGRYKQLSELYLKYRDFIKDSTSFETLIKWLQPCFLSVFDLEEDV